MIETLRAKSGVFWGQAVLIALGSLLIFGSARLWIETDLADAKQQAEEAEEKYQLASSKIARISILQQNYAIVVKDGPSVFRGVKPVLDWLARGANGGLNVRQGELNRGQSLYLLEIGRVASRLHDAQTLATKFPILKNNRDWARSHFDSLNRKASILDWLLRAGSALSALILLAALTQAVGSVRIAAAAVAAAAAANGLFWGALSLAMPDAWTRLYDRAFGEGYLIIGLLPFCATAIAFWLAWRAGWLRRLGSQEAEPGREARFWRTAAPTVAIVSISLAIDALVYLSYKERGVLALAAGLGLLACAWRLPHRARRIDGGQAINSGELRATLERFAWVLTIPVAVILCFNISLALTTFLLLSSFALNALSILALSAGLLGVYARLGGGRSDRGRALLLVPLAAAAWATCAGTHWIWHQRADRIRQNLKDRRYAASWAELQENLPETAYADPALQAAIDRQPDYFNTTADPGIWVGRWDKVVRDYESAKVAPYRPFLAKDIFPILDKHRRLQKIIFPKGSNPAEIRVPRMASFIRTASILNLDAVARAHQGDRLGAWTDLGHALDLSDLSVSSRWLIGDMVAVAIRGSVARAVLNIALNDGLPMPPDLAERLKRSLSDHLVAQGEAHEAAMILDLRDFLEAELDSETGMLGPLRWGLAKVGPDMIAMSRTSHLLFDDPRPDWASLGAALARKESEPENPSILVYYFPVIRQTRALYEKEWEVKARTQLALLSSAALKFRAEKGRFPSALDELAPAFASPELLRDPFSGKPFQCVSAQNPAALELASVGPDGRGLDSRQHRLAVRLGAGPAAPSPWPMKGGPATPGAGLYVMADYAYRHGDRASAAALSRSACAMGEHKGCALENVLREAKK